MTNEGFEYRLRGHRVPRLSGEEVAGIAARVCRVIGMKKVSFTSRRIGKLINQLEFYGIHIDVIDDDEWIDATRATVDTKLAMIYMPEKLYDGLCRGRAEAVRIFLHELGHIFLCHRPLLHFSEELVGLQHDSEWQADHFADSVVGLLGLKRAEPQLEFRF